MQVFESFSFDVLKLVVVKMNSLQTDSEVHEGLLVDVFDAVG